MSEVVSRATTCFGGTGVPPVFDRRSKPRRFFAARHTGGTPVPPKKKRGFTIIESLVAGLILAMFAAAIAGAVTRSSMAASRATDRRQAAMWLDEVLTRIDAIGPARLADEGPVRGPLDERYEWSAEIVENAALPYLYDVAVTVRYDSSAGGEVAVRGYTRLYDPPGARASMVTWEGLGE